MAERVLRGVPASPGVAVGRARVLDAPAEAPAHGPGPTRAPAAEAERAPPPSRRPRRELDALAARLRAAAAPTRRRSSRRAR